ncbi:MAG: hypothetical protein DWP95_11770 [Proteobacteria bacterium]|nr:MAG: hypothetical protein DWP95_11770 [Pseudomonadota bacterium]
MKYKLWQKWLLGIFRLVIFLLACYFIYHVIQENITALKALEVKHKPLFVGTFIVSNLIYIMLMMALVFAWLVLLKFKEPQRCAKIYFKSQIMKYLPGNIFHFMYRHQQTKNKNFTHKQLGMAALHETIILIIGAFLVSQFLFIWPGEITWLTNWLPMPFWVLFLIEVIGAIFVAKILINTGFLTTLISYFAYFSGMGLITYLLIFALGFESQPYLFITACFSASWLAGYVIPGAPGGTGVREVVFILLCTPKMAEYEALIIIALIRLLSILAETIIYLMASRLSQPYRHFSIWSDRTMP